MEDLLNRIVADIRTRRRGSAEAFSSEEFLKRLNSLPPNRYRQEDTLRTIKESFFLIAECKHASPSKGFLCSDYDPIRIAKGYQAGGAAAISVLTEEKFFHGSPQHFQAVREAVDIPLLWKDFVVHEEQIAQSRILGADLILLIFRILPRHQVHRLLEFALRCGLLPLVEIFIGDDPQEIITTANEFPGQFLIGINNRDLSTFHTDIAHSEMMYRKLSPLHDAFSFISESGIETREDIHRLQESGFRGALVGESLIKKDDPAHGVRELLS